MIIEDEKKKLHHIKFIAHKNGLSAGWKKFANRNNLLEGDVLIFQLIEQFKFKVTSFSFYFHGLIFVLDKHEIFKFMKSEK